VLSYSLLTEYGQLATKFRAGDLMSYTGTVHAKEQPVLSLREAAKFASPENAFIKSSCNCTTGCKTGRCSCRSSNIKCSTQCHQSTTCANCAPPEASQVRQQTWLLNSTDISILESHCEWLTDCHMYAVSSLLHKQFPGINGLFDAVTQESNKLKVAGNFVHYSTWTAITG